MTHAKGGTNTTKDVIYIDVDDEITAIIDKVHASDKKIVALVLPKRAAVLQSIVNMKLLKRAAGDTKKSLVLITSEHGLLPLAGSVGIHVAKSLNSKPEVPDAPARATERADGAEEVAELEDTDLDAGKTVGELSGQHPTDDDDDETIELDDEGDASGGAEKSAKDGQKSKLKKFKIPDFNKFRVMLILAGVGVLLLGMVGYAAIAVWPKATVTIQTDSQSVTSRLVLTLKTAADTQIDAEKAIVPAQSQEVKKTLTQEAAATGQKNNGEKSVGTVKMVAKNCTSLSTPKDVPAGSGITANGKTYITQEKATFGGTGVFDGSCLNFTDSSVAIEAQAAGASYDAPASTSFTVSSRSDVTATGSASGGTDKIVKVVSQADIDGAKQKITEQDTAPIVQELRSALIGRDLFPIDATLTIGQPETSLSVEANAEAEAVTVTQTITYTLLGAKEDDLEKVVAKDAEGKIDAKKQSISSYGLDGAYFSLQGVNADETSVSMQTTAVAGAELNAAAIKKQVAGKKAGDAKEILLESPGVTSVTVEYSPFWVSAIPKKVDKITVVIEEPKATANDTESSP